MRPPLGRTLLERGESWLESLRLSVSRAHALAPMALLGIATGLLAGITIVAFRLFVDWGQAAVVPGGEAGNFEELAPAMRFLLPLVGGLALAALFALVPAAHHWVGILHVLERLAYHQGHLPWRNALVQLIGGAITLIAGHSVGREGPSAHLGAASAALPGSLLHLPHNALRVLAASGAAAGIAASFNTPLAGIAFSLEVLALEYTAVGFAPVILATVGATTIVRAVYGDAVAFATPTEVGLASLSELPLMVALGVISALLAVGFTRSLVAVSEGTRRIPVWLRLPVAGAAVGVTGLLIPDVLGVSYDTINAAFAGQVGLAALAALLAGKLLATALGIGLGLPGGVIGPALVMGGAAGGIFAHAAGLLPLEHSSPALYIAVSMGALLAAALHAPLTGLLMILELTAEPMVIFPGMLAVIAATVTAGLVGRPQSIFQALMRSQGLDYNADMALQSLRRIGVAAVMDTSVSVLPAEVSGSQVDQVLAGQPRWILVRELEEAAVVMPALDLASARKRQPNAESINLLELPAHRQQAMPVRVQATLLRAVEILDESGADILYVVRRIEPGVQRVYGVVTRETIETAYRR